MADSQARQAAQMAELVASSREATLNCAGLMPRGHFELWWPQATRLQKTLAALGCEATLNSSGLNEMCWPKATMNYGSLRP